MKPGDLVIPGKFGAVTIYNDNPQPRLGTTNPSTLTRLKANQIALVISVVGDFAIIVANNVVGYAMIAVLEVIHES